MIVICMSNIYVFSVKWMQRSAHGMLVTCGFKCPFHIQYARTVNVNVHYLVMQTDKMNVFCMLTYKDET